MWSIEIFLLWVCQRELYIGIIRALKRLGNVQLMRKFGGSGRGITKEISGLHDRERFTGIGGTCGLKGKEELGPEQNGLGHDSASMGFVHRKCRHRLRVGVIVLAQHI